VGYYAHVYRQLDTNFGANAGAAKAAWIAAAEVFTSHFADNININIRVTR
jgi:hypothetical protein